MMRGQILIASTACAVLLAGCWADFPDSRFEADAAVKPDAPVQDSFVWTDQGTVDDKGIVADSSDTGPTPDKGPQLDTTPWPDKGPTADTTTCTPNAFISCSAADKLLKCNNKGDGTLEVSCAPYVCNATAGRCNECTVGSAATCAGNNLVTCSAAGLKVSTPCALGCQAGACCQNVDKDNFTDCAGDCNDNDPLVFPGQTAYQTTASNGSYDYDCDKTEEREYPALVNCHLDSGKCVGTGWASQVPACGAQGSLVTCTKQGSKCDPDPAVTSTQGCL